MKKKIELSEDRPETTISIKIPLNVKNDLERVSRSKGMTSLQALIKFYTGQGLRKDLDDIRRRNYAEQARIILGKHNIDPEIIDEVVDAVF